MLSGSQITCVRIPASIEKLAKECCFANCQNLTRVEIDDHCHLLEFGDSLFSNCSSLRSLTIPKSVTTLGSCCFLGCGNLTSISFPLGSQLRKIGVRCFEDTRFHSVMIPASVKEIGEAAFRGCIYLSNVHNIWNSIEFDCNRSEGILLLHACLHRHSTKCGSDWWLLFLWVWAHSPWQRSHVWSSKQVKIHWRTCVSCLTHLLC